MSAPAPRYALSQSRAAMLSRPGPATSGDPSREHQRAGGSGLRRRIAAPFDQIIVVDSIGTVVSAFPWRYTGSLLMVADPRVLSPGSRDVHSAEPRHFAPPAVVLVLLVRRIEVSHRTIRRRRWSADGSEKSSTRAGARRTCRSPLASRARRPGCRGFRNSVVRPDEHPLVSPLKCCPRGANSTTPRPPDCDAAGAPQTHAVRSSRPTSRQTPG